MDYKSIFKLRDNFIKKTVGISLYDYQKEFSNQIIKSVIDNKGETTAAMYCRQSGKTEAVCSSVFFLICFYYYIVNGLGKQSPRFFNIGIFAPQQEQSKTDFDRIKDYLKLLDKIEGFDLTVETCNGNTIKITSTQHPPITIYCFTLSPTSHPESKTLHLIIYEESQDLIDFRIDKTASPMGASTNATEVFIGTAGYTRCRFWNHLNNKDVFKVIADDKKVIKEKRQKFEDTQDHFHLNYKDHIAKKKRELGDHSDEYKTQYSLKWVLERGQFIKYEDLIKLESDYNIPFVDKFGRCYAGVDWGKASDSTVLTIVNDDGKILKWLELQGDDYHNQYEYIINLIHKAYPGVEVIFCDATGSQDQAVDMLRSMASERGLKCVVEGVKFTAQSKDQMYKNLARLMMDRVSEGQVVEEATLKIPAHYSIEKERFIKQFIDLQKEIRGNMWKCGHPEGNEYHDDYCDSLALACLGFLNNYQVYTPMIA